MTLLVKDTFTDTNGTLLTAHTPDAGGGNWQVVEQNNAAPKIQSNGLQIDPVAANYNETSVALPKSGIGYGTNDYVVTGTIQFNNNDTLEQYITGRVDTGAGGFKKYSFGYYRGGAWQLRKYTTLNGSAGGGVQVLAQAATSVPSVGSHTLVMRIVTISGNTVIQCKVDGAIVISATTDSSSPYLTGIAGVVGWNQNGSTNPAGWYMDAFQVDTIPSGAQDVLITTAPGGAVPATVFAVQPSGKIADAFGNAVTGQADNITISVQSGPGVISGTTTVAVNTGTGGWAFTNLALSLAGTYTLLLTSANGFSPTTVSVVVFVKSANFSGTLLGAAMTDAGLIPLDGGILEIRDGTQPANTGVAATGTLGAKIVLENPATWNFGTTGNSVVNPCAKVVGLANITPTWARLYKADNTTVLMDITCGPAGILQINSGTTIAVGQRVQLECLTFVDSSQTITVSTTVQGEVAVGGTLDSNTAELPRTFLNSALPFFTQTKTCGPVGRDFTDLQTAVNTLAASGIATLLLVDNGYDYTPPGGAGLLLPSKGTAVLWICAHDLTQVPFGVRMTPALAASQNIPKIRLDNGGAAVYTTSGSQYYRITGFEITPTNAQGPSPAYSLLNIQPDNNTPGGQGNSFGDMPHHIVVERNYIHGNANTQLVRGVAANGDNVQIVDNWIGDIHHESADAQGCGFWMNAGPVRITNNTLKGTGQSILIGGAESRWARLPSDIEVRYNTLEKDPAWFGVYNDIKTIMEMKCGRRCLIEGNDILFNWNSPQSGWVGACMTFKTVNQDGENNVPYWRLCDVTMRYNRIQFTGTMFNAHPLPEASKPGTPAARIVYRSNLGYHLGQSPANIVQYGMQFDTTYRASCADMFIDHNTLVVPIVNFTNHGFYLGDFGGPQSNGGTSCRPHQRWTVTNNIFCFGSNYPLNGRDFPYVDESIAYYLDPVTSIISRNLIVGGLTEASGPPVSTRAVLNQWMVNTSDPTYNAVGFTSISTDNYVIAPGSPYKAVTGTFHALDGTDLGADVNGVLTAIAGTNPGGGGGGGGGGGTGGQADTNARIRTLEILVTTSIGSQTVAVTGVNFYRTDYELSTGHPYPLTVTPSEFGGKIGVPQSSPYDVFIGELIPAMNKIRITATMTL